MSVVSVNKKNGLESSKRAMLLPLTDKSQQMSTTIFGDCEQHSHKSDSFHVGQETVPRTWQHKKFLT